MTKAGSSIDEIEDNGKRRQRLSDDGESSSSDDQPASVQKVKTGIDDKNSAKRWTPEQDEALRASVAEHEQRNWKAIATKVPGRNHAQCLQRWNKVLKPGLVKGHWSFEEDSILERMVLQGCHSWGQVAANIPGRTPKQCRERWRNHLDPCINKGPFTPEEDKVIMEMYNTHGNRWTQIAESLPGRTEDAVKIRWKVLNPNPKTKAKPGRPKLMPGSSASKSKSSTPPDPFEVAAARAKFDVDENAPVNATVPVQPSSYNGGYPVDEDRSYPLLAGLAKPNNSSAVRPVSPETVRQPAVNKIIQQYPIGPVQQTAKELLQSHGRSSLLSIGSITSLASFSDLLPEELLQSAEFDNLLRSGNVSSFEKTGLLDSFGKKGTPEHQKNVEALHQLIAELNSATGMTPSESYAGFDEREIAAGHDSYQYHRARSSIQQQPQYTARTTEQEVDLATLQLNPSAISNQVTAATDGLDLSDPEMLQNFSLGSRGRSMSSKSRMKKSSNIYDYSNSQMPETGITHTALDDLVMNFNGLTDSFEKKTTRAC